MGEHWHIHVRLCPTPRHPVGCQGRELNLQLTGWSVANRCAFSECCKKTLKLKRERSSNVEKMLSCQICRWKRCKIRLWLKKVNLGVKSLWSTLTCSWLQWQVTWGIFLPKLPISVTFYVSSRHSSSSVTFTRHHGRVMEGKGHDYEATHTLYHFNTVKRVEICGYFCWFKAVWGESGYYWMLKFEALYEVCIIALLCPQTAPAAVQFTGVSQWASHDGAAFGPVLAEAGGE